MKMKAKMIFSAAMGAWLLAFSSAQAATANASANMAPDDTNANVNLNATMTRLFGDPVIAKGKHFEIKQSDLDDMMAGIRAAAAQRNQTIPQNQLKLIKGKMLNQLIDLHVLLQKATAADKAYGKQQFEKVLQEIKTNQKLTDAEFDQKLGTQLKLLGISKEKWEQQNIDQATILAVLKRELHITVTAAEAKKYYDEHPGEFELPQRVRVDRIFLSTRDPATGAALSGQDKAAKEKEAENILKQARSGADFGKLVQKYSDDPAAKEDGGEVVIARGELYRQPELEAELFSMKTNQVTDIMTNAGGYYFIKVLEKLPAKKLDYDSVLPNQTPPNAITVSDYIEKVLANQKITKQAPAYLAKLRKEDGVEILDPDLKAAVQESQAGTGTNAPAAPMVGK